METDSRESKQGRPESGRRGAQIYTGENYTPERQTKQRRIGSLVQSEQDADSRENQTDGERRVRQREQSRETKRRQTRQAQRAKSVHHSGSQGPFEEAENRPVQPGSWKEKLRERRRKRLRRIFLALGCVMVTAYTAAAVYFSFHFYEGTMIYGIDCSQMTAEEAKLEAADKLGDYVLQIRERENRTEQITAAQIGLTFVDNNSIDRMMKAQRSYIWPVMILMEKSQLASVAFSYDRDRAKEALESLDCMDELLSVAPQDAYIAPTDTGFEVVDEVMGTTLDPEKTLDAVLAALDRGEESISLEEKECYVNPEIYHDNEELVKDTTAMSELARASIIYDFGDRQEIVNASVIEDWIVELADGSFVIDDMCVTQFVEEMAAKYDTFGLTREFYTSLGTTVTLTGGDYGWCMDQEATIVDLLNALASGYRGTMQPEYIYTAMSRDTNDIGYTYVEICISQQRMWCYENGTCIVDTPVVTGNPNKGNATPSGGVWAIDAKKRDAILEGEGYEAPVDYWMPFNGDVGIHDLKSRAYFGGTIYLSNGSHGCVNTPYEQVKMIYNAVSIGTPVIVYE